MSLCHPKTGETKGFCGFDQGTADAFRGREPRRVLQDGDVIPARPEGLWGGDDSCVSGPRGLEVTGDSPSAEGRVGQGRLGSCRAIGVGLSGHLAQATSVT